MKTLIILSFVVANLFACNFGLLNRTNSESEILAASPTPNTDACQEENYKHKSEAEIAAMTLAHRINEELKEQLHHMPAGAGDEYLLLLSEYIRMDGVKVMPVLTEIANQHKPNTTSRCERLRFFVAVFTANDIDEGSIRLRGTKEGLSTIEALEGALQRMKEAGFDNEKYEKDYYYYLEDLKRLRGTSIRDSIIRDTLRVKHNIQMSDNELLEFSNFLTSLDPTYPGWSKIESATPPLVLKDSKKYYEAYLKFKAKK